MVRVLIPNGARIKELRKAREIENTQKEVAYKAGLGIRTLRLIENENHPMDARRLRKLAAVLSVPFQSIVFAAHGPRLVDDDTADSGPKESVDTEPVILPAIPRYEEVLIGRVKGAKELSALAGMAGVVVPHFLVEMDAEISDYVKEMLCILSRTCVLCLDDQPDQFDELEFPELARLRRLKELFVLLKGNDVLVHADINHRFYSDGEERHIPGLSCEAQLVVAFAPPGNEDYARVTVDNGRSIPAGPPPF